MSYKEACEDGIRMETGHSGGTVYYPVCSVCGVEFWNTMYTRGHTYICPHCKKRIAKEKKRQERLMDPRTKEEIRFDNAVQKLRKYGILDETWDSAIEVAKKRMYSYGSIPEAMLAISLIHYKYGIIPQQRVGDYTVDFAVPKRKLIIEVDGFLYHANKNEGLRDIRIVQSLGADWKVIHVPAEMIEKSIDITMAFIAEKEKTTVLRRQ